MNYQLRCHTTEHPQCRQNIWARPWVPKRQNCQKSIWSGTGRWPSPYSSHHHGPIPARDPMRRCDESQQDAISCDHESCNQVWNCGLAKERQSQHNHDKHHRSQKCVHQARFFALDPWGWQTVWAALRQACWPWSHPKQVFLRRTCPSPWTSYLHSKRALLEHMQYPPIQQADGHANCPNGEHLQFLVKHLSTKRWRLSEY